MPEPFKNLFNEKAIRNMSKHLVRVGSEFDGEGFVAFAIEGLDGLELKQRSNQITKSLELYLPKDFPHAVKILLASLDPVTNFSISEMEHGSTANGIRGWPVMAMADYIAWNGQNHLELSLAALREMTMRSSSEWAIRSFLQNHQILTLNTLKQWSRDENEHVRRLVSEGTRPRLPWGMRLFRFVKDPAPVIDLLERLKDDNSEYVRRSVANNLNDIAKDHAGLVASIAQSWMKDASPERTALVRHGLRTLIKQGHTGALKALGYTPAKLANPVFRLLTPDVKMGGALEFELKFSSPLKSDQPLIIDYAVHHMRANGKTTPKVFKWKSLTLKGGQGFQASKHHVFRPVTTRRYYSGRHRIEILVNGNIICGADFSLQI